jgi:acetylornithine deacetylase/succinyl-diaminopimelate desuccinylase-like protein
MTVDLFQMMIKDGKVFGRSVCDTKGSTVVMLWALRDYASRDTQINNVTILLLVDEEVSKIGAKAFIESQLPTLGWRQQEIVE